MVNYDSSTNIFDSSTSQNKGTWAGGQDANSGWTLEGAINNGTMFDGSDDYITVGSPDEFDFPIMWGMGVFVFCDVASIWQGEG